MPPLAAGLWKGFPVYQVFGANTNVGKTIFSTIICKSLSSVLNMNVKYLKPVSTGPLDDADIGHLSRFARIANTKTLFQFEQPVSPHIAALKSKMPVPSDLEVVEKIRDHIREGARDPNGFMLVETAGGVNSPGPSGTIQADLYRPLRLPTILIADSHLGGISTSISAYESLHMRGFEVVGVAMFKDRYYNNHEYLRSYFRDREILFLPVDSPPTRSRNTGSDQEAMEDYYNTICPRTDFGRAYGALPGFLWGLLNKNKSRIEDLEAMASLAYERIWWPFTQHQSIKPENITTIDSAYGDYFQTHVSTPKLYIPETIAKVEDGERNDLQAPEQENITTTDGSIPKDIPKIADSPNDFDQQSAIEMTMFNRTPNLLQSTIDGSASWWTQGLGHGNPELTMAAGHAAGRYGHVMFAEAIHEPALKLATSLLEICNNPRLKRVFYSDNGSTGMEVAVKMALKAACVRYNWDMTEQGIEILGLQGSYHGDTMGCVDMSEPSVYNEKIPWYKGRGFWFECPTVKMQGGQWTITDPSPIQQYNISETVYPSLQAIFDFDRDQTARAEAYKKHIVQTLEHLVRGERRRFGALVMEPVVLGAGGMLLVDPLFQRVLTQVVRNSEHLFRSENMAKTENYDVLAWTGLPVVADEVFTGLFRLGHKTSCSLLNIHPDISVHAKLLTGGLIPLCTTLASESIFEAFLADNKTDALLHGHSYTAHPVGCAVANATLKQLLHRQASNKWYRAQVDWRPAGFTTSNIKAKKQGNISKKLQKSSQEKNGPLALNGTPLVWSVWRQYFVTGLSNATDHVEGVWALGSVLAITFRDDETTGYTSMAAKKYQKLLLDGQGENWNVHSRVLGNVLYLMASQITVSEDLKSIEGMISKILDLNIPKRRDRPKRPEILQQPKVRHVIQPYMRKEGRIQQPNFRVVQSLRRS